MHELLNALEDEDEDDAMLRPNEISIALMPPTNACNDVSDEDSGNEGFVNVNNLSGSQLRAEAEIVNNFILDDLYDDSDDIPLSLLRVSQKKNITGNLKI